VAGTSGEWDALHQIVDKGKRCINTMSDKAPRKAQSYHVLTSDARRILPSSVAREQQGVDTIVGWVRRRPMVAVAEVASEI